MLLTIEKFTIGDFICILLELLSDDNKCKYDREKFIKVLVKIKSVAKGEKSNILKLFPNVDLFHHDQEFSEDHIQSALEELEKDNKIISDDTKFFVFISQSKANKNAKEKRIHRLLLAEAMYNRFGIAKNNHTASCLNKICSSFQIYYQKECQNNEMAKTKKSSLADNDWEV